MCKYLVWTDENGQEQKERIDNQEEFETAMTILDMQGTAYQTVTE